LKKDNYAILWDLDGTIVETKACHLFSFQKVFEKHGYAFDQAVFDVHFGRNNSTLVPLLLGFDPDPDLLSEIIRDKEALYRDIIPGWIKTVPGVESWLAVARDLHFPQAIASSAPMENIITMLSSVNLEGYFTAFVSGADLPTKPEPDVFLKAAETLNVHPQHCLVIEDALAGVKAAQNAGMYCIAVATSYPREDLSLADLVVDDFRSSFRDVLKNTLGWG